MKIVEVIPGRDDISIMPFVHRQVSSLERENIDIYKFCLKSRTSIFILFLEFIRFRKLISKIDPDIVHAQFGTMTSFFCSLATNIPLIITFRGSDLNPAPGSNVIRNRFGHLLSQISSIFADYIICVSDQLTNKLWFSINRISVIPSGIDVDLFKPIPKTKARKLLYWEVNARIVLFNAGKNPKGKRIDLAKKAVQIAKRKFPELELYTLHGNVPPDNMPLYYNAADCLLLTSEYEGSPNVVKEAIACNCPVVSVEVGDVAERLKYVFPSYVVGRSPKKISRGICKILEIDKRSNGSNHIHDVSDEILSEKILEIYKEIRNKKHE